MTARYPRVVGLLVAVATAMSAGPALLAQTRNLPPPTSDREDDLPPVVMFERRTLHNPPRLEGSGEAVEAFVAWAGQSVAAEREDARAAIARAGEKPAVSNAVAGHLCRLARQALHQDHTLALLELSILGELRNPGPGFACLTRILWVPPPAAGTFNDELGDVVEAESQATVQAKAVDGLAYLRTAGGDAQVLRAIKSHPSRVVRAEAIDAYLWNHGDSAAARRRLLPLVQVHGEEIFLDRIRREDGEGAQTFDPKLAAFLRAHPELLPGEDQSGGANPPKDQAPEATPMHPVDGFVFGPTCGATAPACNGTCPEGLSCVSHPDAGCTCVARVIGQ